MSRPSTGDVPVRRHQQAERDAVRSYVTRDGARFIISKLTRGKSSAEDSWRVTHQASGGVLSRWSFGECIDLIRRMQTAPKSEEERWIVLRWSGRGSAGSGQVLFDRASGEWWQRSFYRPVTPEELAAMSKARPISACKRADARA